MFILFTYVCIDLLTDLYVVNQTKKESFGKVSILLNFKWLLFMVYYYHQNTKKFRNISV